MDMYIQKCWKCREWVLFRDSEKSVCPRCQEYIKRDESAITIDEWESRKNREFNSEFYDI